ncbi:metalloendopeptidase OMA1%2C mitochondrial isoform X1 [Xyrichtys novacula]|uniref:Metalloendopeptidase OMA1, mitochondrial n=1 Tax=Xyrichtys novacula TaxID=13765 RepID=A0AAV1FGH6_XYRNO|nr:metalloendopeptidase OMA1%2C mitochondrial isoform X1 [Xyrichtys novacula]
MGLFCYNLLRSTHLCFRSAHLVQNLNLSKTLIRCNKNTDPLHLRAASPASLFLNGRTVLFRFRSRTTSLLDPGPVLTRCGLHFHTSAPVRALPGPLLWMVLKPLQKLVAIVLGRSIRKWWVDLPANRQQLLREWVRQRRWHLAAGAGVTMVIVVLLLLTHLDESPITGRTRLLVFSKDKFMELAALTSRTYKEEFAELMLPVSDARHQVVEQVVQHLAQRNKDIPEDGKVFMFTGMLDVVTDIHQLTIVLGHEMAHALLGHSAEEASLSHVVDLLSLILLTAIWAMCPQDSLALLGQWVQGKLSQLMFHRPYSRKLETEADEVGLQLAAKACADVRAGPVFWQQMEIREQLTGEPTLPEWLSTHPSHRNRFTQLDRLIPQALELRESCVCPALPPTDPRAVFSQSVRVLLEDTKNKERGVGEEGGLEGPRKPHRPPLPQIPASPLPSAALLTQTAPLLSSKESQGSKVSELAVPAAAAEGGTPVSEERSTS